MKCSWVSRFIAGTQRSVRSDCDGPGPTNRSASWRVNLTGFRQVKLCCSSLTPRKARTKTSSALRPDTWPMPGPNKCYSHTHIHTYIHT